MSATTSGRLRLRPSGPTAAAAWAHGGIGRSSSRYAERVSDDLAALANLATVPLVWPEARRAWRALRRR